MKSRRFSVVSWPRSSSGIKTAKPGLLRYLLVALLLLGVQSSVDSVGQVHAVPTPSAVSDLGALTNGASVNVYQTPVVAINNAGKGVAGWLGNGAGLKLASYTASSDTWSATETLGNGTSCGYFPSANLSAAGDLIAGCVSSNTNNRSLWLKQSGTWGSEYSFASSYASRVQVHWPTSGPEVAYENYYSGGYQTEFRQHSGGAWSSATRLSTCYSGNYSSFATAADGVAVIGMSGAQTPPASCVGGSHIITHLRSYDPGTNTWSGLVGDARPAYSQGTVYTAAAINDAATKTGVVVWHGNATSVYLQRWTLSGGWSGLTTITNAAATGAPVLGDAHRRNIQVGIDNSGRIIVAWIQSDGTNNRVRWTWHDGSSWSPTAWLSDAGQDAGGLSLAVSKATGTAVVAYHRGDGSNTRINFQQFYPGTATWGAPVLASASGADSVYPSIAINDSEQYVMGWAQKVGANFNMKVLGDVASASDTTAPTLTSGSLLANGQTVRLVFNEAVHATTAPASAFTVTASAVNHTPTAVAVSGSNIDLTLPVTLEGTATLTVAYVAPASNSATSNAAVQDLAGNDAASFSNRPVTNNSTADATAPTVTWTSPSTPSSSRTLSYTLTFSEAVSGIVSGDFRVLGTATGCTVTPSAASTSTSITVSVTCSSDGTVLLELLSNTVVDGSSNTGPSVNATATQITINTSVATTTTTAPAPTTTATGTATTTTIVTQSGGTTAGPVPGSPSASATTVARSGSPSATSTSVASSAGGGASAAIVPTTTTEPDVTSTVAATPDSTLPVIDVPRTEVGGASALIGGVEVAAKVSREDNELIVDVGPIVARIWATSRSGGKVPLDAEGRLRLQVGDSVTVDIEGFDAATPVEVRLYSDPVLLGRSQVGASGTLAAAYEIPEGIEQGNHTVVLVGTGKGDSVTLGLSVAIGDEPTGINPWVIILPIGLAVLGALLLPVALRRRRREAAA